MLGSLPIAFVGDMSDWQMGISISVASGMMTGCSVVLAIEALLASSCLAMVVGITLGGLLIQTVQWIFAEREGLTFGNLKGSSATSACVIFLSMILHSLGEGLSLGVSAAEIEQSEKGHGLNSVVLLSLAIHNIPEGMATCMAYRSKDMPLKNAAWCAFLCNLPQPMSAMVSFGCMQQFVANKFALPMGLGVASGAMFYVVCKELVPEALDKVPSKRVVPVMIMSSLVVLMLDAYNHFGSHAGPAEIMPPTYIYQRQDL